MIFRSIILLLLCLSASGQYVATHYVDFEGGTDGTDPTITTLNNSLHGGTITAGIFGSAWGLNNSGHSMQFATAGQKSLLGNITVYGTAGYGPGGSMGIVSHLDGSLGFMQAYFGHCTAASAGLWVKTDVATSDTANIDWWDLKCDDGAFVNVILYAPGDGTLKFSAEISYGSAPGNTVAISPNTYYWPLLGLNIGGTNGNKIWVYDTSMSIVGKMENSGAMPSPPSFFQWGYQNGANVATRSIWSDNIMVETNGVFPILPGSPTCTYAPPASNSIPWTVGQNVGVQGDIPHRTTIYTNFTSANTMAEIQSGIAACPSNQVVKLGPGYYSISAGNSLNLYPYNGVTLRGSGSGTNPAVDTILRASADMTGQNLLTMGLETSQSGTTISSGWAKGASNLTVASTVGFSVGQLVNAVEMMDTNVMWTAATGDSKGTNYLIQQPAKITAIAGSVITIWPPLNYELTPNPSPKLLNYGNAAWSLIYSGVEDLTIATNGTFNIGFAINMEQCINCWQSNVTMIGILGYVDYNLSSTLCEITYCTIPGQPSYGTSHGGILLGGQHNFGISGFYVYNNIVLLCNPAIQINGMSGSVVSYNLCPNSQFSDLTQVTAIDLNHTGDEANNNDVEGNIVNGVDSDGFTAGVIAYTLFRNWGIGWTIASTNYNSRPLSLAHWARYCNVVGNVWGATNYIPDYYTVTNSTLSYSTGVVMILGYPNGTGNANYTGAAPPWGAGATRDTAFDWSVTNTTIIHANWDAKNLTQLFYSGQCATLPNSLYLNGKPAWWPDSMAYPGWDPSNGYTNLYWGVIPAGNRYLASAIPGSGVAMLSGPATLSGPAKLYTQ